MNEDRTCSNSDTALTQPRSPRVRKDAHKERRERQAWALQVIKNMRKSPSAPDPDLGPMPAVHVPGDDPNAPGVVYFAYCAGRIKIGYTTDIANRMGMFSTHSPFPLRLILTIRGSMEDEAAYHAMFAADRRHLEWFELSLDLREFLIRRCEPEDGFAMLFEAEYEFHGAFKDCLAYVSDIIAATKEEMTNASGR